MIAWKLFAMMLASAAAPAVVPPLAAKVEAHRVTHLTERVSVRVPPEAKFVGSDRFDLYGIADAEVHVFAEADRNKRVKRLYWIQFESYWPSKPELTHDYTDNKRMQLWGTTTWVQGGPSVTSKPSRPGSDREHVVKILERAGYRLPAEVMSVRLVQLLDDPKGTGHGRHELMIIYAEDLAPTGKTVAGLTTAAKPNAGWPPLEAALVARARRTISVQRR